MLSAVTIYKEIKFSSAYPLILHQVFCGCSKTLDPPPPVHIKIKAQSLGLVPWANVNHGGVEDTT